LRLKITAGHKQYREGQRIPQSAGRHSVRPGDPERTGYCTTAVEETGDTYRENAQLKACVFSRAKRIMLTLADDSGIEVDALHGEPGVMSARYAGENASDAERVNFLLSKLKDVPQEKRTARFYCVIAIAKPDGTVEYCDGECKGTITFKPSGATWFRLRPRLLSA
jgi:XTP/dITP diphosphohydrolase